MYIMRKVATGVCLAEDTVRDSRGSCQKTSTKTRGIAIGEWKYWPTNNRCCLYHIEQIKFCAYIYMSVISTNSRINTTFYWKKNILCRCSQFVFRDENKCKSRVAYGRMGCGLFFSETIERPAIEICARSAIHRFIVSRIHFIVCDWWKGCTEL